MVEVLAVKYTRILLVEDDSHLSLDSQQQGLQTPVEHRRDVACISARAREARLNSD